MWVIASPREDAGAGSPFRRTRAKRNLYAHIRQHMTERTGIIMPAVPKASEEVRACA
jgi:hypothetical protein